MWELEARLELLATLPHAGKHLGSLSVLPNGPSFSCDLLMFVSPAPCLSLCHKLLEGMGFCLS